MDKKKKPVILCIMDGWGLAPASATNAVSAAHTPIFDEMMQSYPNATLQASGPAVGLPEGQPGNSEVGHMNIGAGRCVLQDLPRIHNAIAGNHLEDLPELQNFIAKMHKTGGKVHLIGLFSTGGVHAHSDHSAALAAIFAKAGLDVILHAITDGRDTLPKVALAQWQSFQEANDAPLQVGTVIGRYFAMDRDNRHERTAKAYDAIVSGRAEFGADDYEQAVTMAYERGERDEFITATSIAGYQGLSDGDGIMMTNFRVDRARQILTALMRPEVIDRNEDSLPSNLQYLSMTPVFSSGPDVPYLFGAQDLSQGLGERVAQAKLSQLRLAETEKYPHVTYFFNGGEETPFAAEERIVVPSPKVATYDEAPMMSAKDVLQAALRSIGDGAHDMLIINFANPDMVGHTGDIAAAMKAV